MDQNTKDSIVSYLEKSYKTIQRLTETNEILMAKNRELFAKNLFYQYKIKLIKNENKELKQKLEIALYQNSKNINTENEFEIL